MNRQLIEKVKTTLSQYYYFQGGKSIRQLGEAIDWRLNVIDKLKKHRSPEAMIKLSAGFCVIQRQIEGELQLYQDQLQDISLQFQQGDIGQEDYESRLEEMTTAILVLSFLAGSQIADEELTGNALEILQSGGLAEVELDLTNLPEEAQTELNSEIAIALQAAPGLAEAIEDGQYDDREQALFSRLAMWTTTALGLVSLGKLYLDAATYQIWLFSPLKDHCDDCFNLNGQVHTVLEWNDFFARTGKRPQSRNLACHGYNCGCGLYNAEGPSVGNFV